jgi:hypothetical protein
MALLITTLLGNPGVNLKSIMLDISPQAMAEFKKEVDTMLETPRAIKAVRRQRTVISLKPKNS